MSAKIFVVCLLISFANSLEQNDKCFSKFMNSSGICVGAKDCSFFPKHRKELIICGFSGLAPIVCCPKNITEIRSILKRKSELSKVLVCFEAVG